MTDCVVTVNGPNDGYALEFRGLHNQIRAQWKGYSGSDRDLEYLGEDPEIAFRYVRNWYCQEEDVPVVVQRLTQNWVGKEVRVYKLAEIHVAKVGQVVSKEVTKDGVLPR